MLDATPNSTTDSIRAQSCVPAVLKDLFGHLKAAQADAKVAAIVVTGANGKFSGGFDIQQFADQTAGADLSSNVNGAFSELVEAGAKPVVAAVSGIALGGGCELSVACAGRVATPGARAEVRQRARAHALW